MSWLGSIFGGGVGDVASSIGSAAKDIEDVFTTSDGEQLPAYRAETDRIQAEQATQLAQIETNRAQAQHPSIFVAGGRPFIMWICGFAMAYHFIFYPLFGAAVQEYAGYPLVDLDWHELWMPLAGLLGLGTLRTYEKKQGTARENMATTPKH